jgi:hypothetical protein
MGMHVAALEEVAAAAPKESSINEGTQDDTGEIRTGEAKVAAAECSAIENEIEKPVSAKEPAVSQRRGRDRPGESETDPEGDRSLAETQKLLAAMGSDRVLLSASGPTQQKGDAETVGKQTEDGRLLAVADSGRLSLAAGSTGDRGGGGDDVSTANRPTPPPSPQFHEETAPAKWPKQCSLPECSPPCEYGQAHAVKSQHVGPGDSSSKRSKLPNGAENWGEGMD